MNHSRVLAIALWFGTLCLLTARAHATITVKDDLGEKVQLAKPAQRIISTAPHITELVFAAGGGKHLVGVDNFSNYPAAAKGIDKIGDNQHIDLERIIALKPDLVVIWPHNSQARQIEQLRKLGIPLFHSDPRKLDDIANNLQNLGQIMGTQASADKVAQDFKQQLRDLRRQYAGRTPVRVFYQVWDKPLYTLNGAHIVSDVLQLCGGENIFASQKIIAPTVSVEAVLKENPEVIFASAERDGGAFSLWKPFTNLRAIKNGNLFGIDGNLLNRSGPRMVAGAALVCQHLEIARQHRKN